MVSIFSKNMKTLAWSVFNYMHLHHTKMRLAMLTVLKLEPDGLGVLAPVCSSMGFLASSVTLRNSMCPLGDSSKLSVKNGNLLACRYLDGINIFSQTENTW